MVEQVHMEEAMKQSRKRKAGQKKGSNLKKKARKNHLGIEGKAKKINPKLKKMLRKKARDYNSDDDGTEEQRVDYSGDESVDDDEEDGAFPEITKFSEGCRAFRIAFKSIMSKTVADESLGPVLSGHNKLVAKKLDEELAERKFKGEAKKEKKSVQEKGHVKPANYLDSHEKFLISVATKGVVKLFNAVNKAQNAQKGLNPSRTKDDKALKKRRKQAFFSELGKTPASTTTTGGAADNQGPSWAPLRDNYMLTNSKLKDWDKMPDTAVTDDTGNISEGSSSDDD